MKLIKRSNGYYYIETYETGNPQKRISTKTKVMSEALKFIYEYSNKELDKLNRVTSLKDFKLEYLEVVKKQFSVGHIKNIEYVFKKFILVFDENRNLNSFTTLEIEKYLLNEYSKSPYSAYISFKVLKAFFNRAINYELLEKNPVTRIKLPRLPVIQPQFLTITELNKILEQIMILMQRNIVFFAFYTGMRQSEILSLTWNQVDLKRRIIHLQNNKNFATKSRKDRDIPMTRSVYNLLSELKSQYNPSKTVTINYIFYKEYGKRWSNNYTGVIFKRACKAAGINQNIHFHSLRHSTASNLAIKGVSLYHIGAILGHAESRTTQVYAHLQQQCLQESIDKLEAI